MMVTDLCQSKILNLLMPYADLQLCAFIIHVKKYNALHKLHYRLKSWP